MKRHNWRARLSALLVLLLCVQMAAPALAAQWDTASGRTVYISTAQEFQTLAQACALDTWSQGKTVVLTGDISLAGVEVSSIPSFGGTFDGRGHTISGVNLSGSVSPMGLFGTLQSGAAVKNLHVRGSIAPDGTRDAVGAIAGTNGGLIENCSFTGTVSGSDSVGGLVGVNDVTGTVRGCSTGGSITGKSMTGGIAGRNLGVISGCHNNARVNITSVDPSLDLSELDLGAAVNLRERNAMDMVNVATDTGGIAGYSTGMILSCTNRAVIGYQHIGYNVGGIAGRSRGHIANCENSGAVFGRKDIGGIVGQAEPNIVLSLSTDQIEELRGELNRLQELVDGAVDDAHSSGSDLSGQLDAIGDTMDSAADWMETLGDQLSRFGDGTTSEIDRGSQILDDVIDRLSPISGDLVSLSGTFSQALERLQDAVDELAEQEPYGTKALEELRDASDGLSQASTHLKNGMRDISSGLEALRDAIAVKDQKKFDEAVEEIHTGMDDLTEAARLTSDALDVLAKALDGEDPDLAAAVNALRGVNEACVPLIEALQAVGEGMIHLRENWSFQSGTFRDGLEELQDGLDDLASASGELGRAMRHLKSAMDNAAKLSKGLGSAGETLSDAVGMFRDAAEAGAEILDAARDLVDYLNGVDPIQITYPSQEIDAAADGLFGAVDRLSGEMESLNGKANTLSDSLAANLRTINGQVRLIMNDLLDAVEEAEHRSDQEVVSDTSEEDIDAVTSGKVLSCVNHADVRGDINTGGVAGAMAVEYELDPEDDLSSNAPFYRREYELKAILQKCVNDGAVICRRDYVGAVCGRVDLGLVTRCEGYGSVESETGDYVGGVAGFSGGTVRDCFAKCRLSGGDYVGGITGAAASEDAGGAVSRCYSLVRVTDHGQYIGAISGSAQGTFRENFFVSDTLAGLDRVSLAGKAQAIDYEQLLREKELPNEFRFFTLRFLAQDEVVKELTFHYGDSFDGDVFPDIPPMEGHFSAWDTQELRDLRFDTDVTAVYTPYITALPGGGRRDDGRPVFLTEGRFSSEGDFTVTAAQLPEEKTASLSGLTFLNRRALLETWTLEGAGETIRYLSPTGNSDGIELYAMDPLGWVKLKTDSAGSYLRARVSGSPVTIAVVSRTSIWWILILTVVLALAALTLVIVLIARRRAARKQAKQAEDAAPPAKPGKKRRKGLLIALIAALALAVAGAVIFFATGLKDDAAAYALLKRYMNKDDSTARLTVEVQGDSRHYIDAQLTRTKVEGKSVTRAEMQGAAVYYCDGLVYLENGQAIETEGTVPDYPSLLSGVFTLYKDSDITVFENSSDRIYGVRVDGDAALPVLENLLPSVLSSLSRVELLDVSLVERGGELAELRFEADSVFADDDGGERPMAISAVLKTADGEDQPVELPARVRDQIVGGDGAAPVAGEDLLRLMESWLTLNARDPLVADVSLSADCGPLVLDEELVWSRTHVDDVEVNGIHKNGSSYYFSKETVYDASGNRENSAGAELFSPRDLLELAYQLYINGEIRCVESGGTDTYMLALDENGMTRVAHTILPDSEKQALSFQSGSVQITITDAGVERIRFVCGGSVKIVVVDVPVSMSAELRFRDPSEGTETEIPGDVLTELSRPTA